MATVTCSIAATIALVSPVAMHRLLFRQRRLNQLVSGAHRLTIAGLTLLGLALVGVAVVVVDMVYGRGAALVGGAVALLGFVSLWPGVPLLMRASRRAGIPAAAPASRARALQPADPPVH